MATLGSPSFEDLLQCSICLERFTQPKVLPCQHTFCLSCLRGIVKDAKIIDCPTCRRSHQVPKKGAAAFQDSLMAVNLLSMFGESMECNDCTKKHMLSECEHCQQQVCANCRATHNRLAGEISILIQALEISLVNPDEKIVQAARTSAKQTENVEADIQNAFDEAIEVLKQRKEETLQQVRTVLKIQKGASQGTTKAVFGAIREELSECGRTAGLKWIKKSLLGVEEMLKGDLEFNFNVSEVTMFGEVKCAGTTVTTATERKTPEGKGPRFARKAGGESDAVAVGDSAGVPHQIQNPDPDLMASKGQLSGPLHRFPAHVDYEAKKQCWVKIIGEYPPNDTDTDDYFEPTYAAYSPVENVLYCLSEGTLLKYDILTGVGQIISKRCGAIDFSITDLGTVMLVDNEIVAKVDPSANNVRYDLAPTVLDLPCSKAVQICCHRNQFAILDSEKKSILKFDEQGILQQEINMNFDVNDHSKMCVDGKGRIYVTGGFRVEGRKDNDYGDDEGCDRCRLSKSMKVSFELVVSILNWDGEEIEKMTIEKNRDFEYSFTARCNQIYRGRLQATCQRDKITDEVIFNNKPRISGICVDGDGFISLTTYNENQIDVYDPKHKLYSTIGKKEMNYSGPKGLSLTPDGRMVVCMHSEIRIL